MSQEQKLDLFKVLLGEVVEDEVEETTPEVREDGEEESEEGMAFKMDPEDLESIMTRAMASAVVAARESAP